MPFSFSTESTSIHAGTPHRSASEPISAVPRLWVLTRGQIRTWMCFGYTNSLVLQVGMRCHTFTESGTQLPETRWSGGFGGGEVPKVYEVSVMQKEYILEIQWA